MKAKIILNQPLTQDRYGLHFEKGEAITDNEYLIKKLKSKGVKVEIIKEEKTINEMTVAELKEYAKENNIEIPSNVKNKADILKFITNYKEDNGDPKSMQTDDGEESLEKTDNADKNLNNDDSKDKTKKDDKVEPKAE